MKIEVITFFIVATLLQQPWITSGCNVQISDDEMIARVSKCDEHSENLRLIYEETSLLHFRPNTSVIKILKSSLLQHFPNIEKLVMDIVHLEEIENGALVPVKNLKSLSLQRNYLRRLNADLFSDVPLLETLKLARNNISSIDPGTFAGLTNLKSLDLSRNDLEILADVFDALTALESIDLSYNRLESLSQTLFSASHHIKSIKLFKNHLKMFDIHLATDRHFCYLNIDNNSIEYFSLTFMQFNDDITEVDCTIHGIHASNNKIKVFDVVRGSVGMIALDNNLLENIENITKITGLTKIDLSNNQELTERALKDLKHVKNLQSLTLKNMNLTQLDPRLFEKLNQLTELDLSNNSLESFDVNVFKETLQDFYKLNLANNRLRSLDVQKLLEKFPNITYLNIKGNIYTEQDLNEVLSVLDGRNITVIR